MKKLVILLASISLVFQLSACTSKDAKEETAETDVAVEEVEETNVDAELEKADEGEAAVADGGNEGFLDEELPEEALGEVATADKADSDSGTEEVTAGVDVGAIEGSDAVGSEPTPSTDESSSITQAGEASSEVPQLAEAEIPEEEPVKKVAPLRKVETVPFKRAGQLLNSVYLARPGDSYATISRKIFGTEDNAQTLADANPFFKAPRPGDKIYYNSPVRPTDDRQMLTYYEDMGLVPEIYVSKEGDNLRSVAKNILGYDGAWKELWAINGVESKGDLVAGTELRYWKGSVDALPPAMPAMPATTVAQQTPPPAEMAPPTDFNQPENTMPEPMQEAATTAAMDNMQNNPPPDLPPPPPAVVNPPPPPPAEFTQAQESPVGGDPVSDLLGGMDQDMLFAIGGAVILLLGMVFMRIARKRRQERDMAAAFNDTQVGT